MKDEVAHLAYYRSVVAERKVLLIEAEAELHASPLWQQVEARRGSLNQAKSKQADAEIAVRQEAMAVFAETGNKAPHPAIKIKVYTVLEYRDEDAIDYAREHLPEALKLDRRIFIRAAKAVAMNFVAILSEPRATIARDLSEYLPRGDDGGN